MSNNQQLWESVVPAGPTPCPRNHFVQVQVPPGPLGSPADTQPLLIIEVPATRSFPILFFFAIWIPLWGFGMLGTLAGGLVQREAGLLLCFPLMAIGFTTAIHEALWQIAGRHHLELTGQVRLSKLFLPYKKKTTPEYSRTSYGGRLTQLHPCLWGPTDTD